VNAVQDLSARRVSGRNIAAWAARGGLLLWAGFWAYFVLAVGISDIKDGLAGTLPVILTWLVALAALVGLAWRWPRLGGLVIIAAGVGSALYFRYPGNFVLLAGPAVLLGGLIALVGRPGGQAGRMPR
jgi:hypothetical protein